MVETHPSCTLYDGFQYQSGQFAMVPLYGLAQRKYVFFVPFPVEPALGGRDEMPYGEGGAEQAVHARNGVAYRHGVPCVAMVTGTDGHEVVLFRLSGRILVLCGHFQCDFHGHRTAVGIENLLHGRRGYVQ